MSNGRFDEVSGLLEPLLSSRLMYTQLCRYVDPYAQAQAQAQAQARALENKTEEEKEERLEEGEDWR